MFKKIIEIMLTVIFVSGALSDTFNWLGVTPSAIRGNSFILWPLKLLNFGIPIYIVSLIFLISMILLRKVILPNFIKSNLTNKILEKDVPNLLDIHIRSTGEQIYFSLDTEATPKLRIWLIVINKGDKEIALDKIKWELFVEQFVKKNVSQLANKLKPKETNDHILLEFSIDSSEVNLLRGINPIGPRGCFYGKIFFVYDGKNYEKDFNFQGINYLINKRSSQNIDLRLSKEQEWALLVLLNQKDGMFDREALLDLYKWQFKKGNADFNVLESELEELKLIDPSSSCQYWMFTKNGLSLASKAHKNKSA